MVRQLRGSGEPGSREEVERPAAGVSFQTVRVGGDGGGGAASRGLGRGGRARLVLGAWVVVLGGLVLNGVSSRPPAQPPTDGGGTVPPVALATPVASGVPAGGPPYGGGPSADPAGVNLSVRARPGGDVVTVHGDLRERRVIRIVVLVDGISPGASGVDGQPGPRETAAVTVKTATSFDVQLPLPVGVPISQISVEANTYDLDGDWLSRTHAELSD